ncbi:MAG: hypothetical protein U1E56_07250 [Bauldia sp.]
MLVFITLRGHARTVESLVRGATGNPIPVCRTVSYERIFRARRARRAVHVFTDLERLSEWELVLAADLFRSLRAVGIVSLNDPARAMGRVELLAQLKAAGINPFGCYRADARPRPERFPVFVRREGDHGGAQSGLLADQDALDDHLAGLRAAGVPLRGLLVTEFAAEPIAPGVWRKLGTFRIGAKFSLHHAIVGDSWLVKKHRDAIVTDALHQQEYDAVAGNRPPAAVREAFDIAGIEWGRADHATYAGRDVIYEINTNPDVRFEPQASPIRTAAKQLSSRRFAGLLGEIDSGDGAWQAFEPKGHLRRQGASRIAFWRPPKRP